MPTIESINILDDRGRVDTTRWLEHRKQDVTASDIAAICGVSPYKSAAQVYYEKRGRVDGMSDNAMLRQGRWFEPAVQVALAEEFPDLEVKKCSCYLRAPALRIGATPDFVAIDPAKDGCGNLQAKIVEAPIFAAEWADGNEIVVPLHYQIQTIVEGYLMGASWAAVAVLVHASFGRSEIKLIPVDMHAGAWLRICDAVAAFWQGVISGVEPPIDPSMDSDLVKRLWPADTGLTVDLTGDNRAMELVDRREQVALDIKCASDEKDEIDTELKAKLGAATYGTLADGRTLAWKSSHRSAFYMPEAEIRTFRVLKAKGKRLRRGEAA